MFATICLLVLQSFFASRAASWLHLTSRNGELPAPNGGNQQTASLVLDVDKNGIEDFIITDRSVAPSVVWFRRQGTNWTKYLVDTTRQDIEAGGAFYDIDGDGDLDIVLGGDYQSNRVWWWENPYPNYNPATPWTRRFIKNSGSNKHHDQIFGDFDRDGKIELVFWNQNASTLFKADIPDDPRNATSWTLTPIYVYSGGEHEGLAAADINNDGTTDIVGGGRWFKHITGSTYAVEVIDDAMRFTRVAAGQLKRGGRAEVVFVPGDADGPVKWYEWNGSSWASHDPLGTNVIHGHSLQIADINRDGSLDIFIAEMRLGGGNPNAKMRMFYGDGNGTFSLSEVETGYGNHESRLGDLDGDGDLDILGKPYDWDVPRIDVWLQNGSDSLPPFPLTRWHRHVIDSSKPWRAVFVGAADVDNDGLKDIVTGGWWYKNPGTNSLPWFRDTIGTPLNNMAALFDFDNDGAIDVLGTKGQGGNTNTEFVWGHNNGSGAFTILQNIPNGDGDFLQGATTHRFQKGAPLEVALSWHAPGVGVQILTVPSDPVGTAWSWRRASTTSQDEQLSGTDVDSDGTIDLILGTKWLRNDGSWTAFDLNTTPGDPDRNRVADMNRDGRSDVVVGFEAISMPGKLAWYEHPASSTSLWDEHIISNAVIGPMSVDVADMDHDGDMDVVVGEHNPANPGAAQLIIFENADGNGGTWNQHVIGTGDEHHDGAQIVDIDNDGDLDITSIGWDNPRVLLYENLAIDVTPLSVQLASFTASIINPGAVRLQWTTISETNNYGFVPRRQEGQMPPVELGFLAGYGTTTEPQHYEFIDSLAPHGVLRYHLKQIDLDGSEHFSEVITVNTTTDVGSIDAPLEFSLYQNYPNPFNPSTIIRYSLPEATYVRLEVFNTLGQVVATLARGNQSAGNYALDFDSATLSSGIYFYRLTSTFGSLTRKMIIIR